MAKKKILISIIAIFSAIVLGLLVFLGVRACYKPITFTIQDTLPNGQGKTARVVLLGGQSNASGCSHNEYLEKNLSAEEYAEYENGYDNVYINYLSGLNQSQEFVKCTISQGEMENSFGPELGMADKLNELYPNDSFFIIKCAWGGTNLFEQWLSPTSKGKTGKLYKQFVAFVETSMNYLISKNYNVSIEGMCWMQGESDSFSVEHATGYQTHLTNLIQDLRTEFSRYAAKDGIAFIDAYIADNPVFWVYCDMVNASKKSVAETVDKVALVDTITHGLQTDKEPEPTPDIPHYDALSEIKLGHLFIEELIKFF